MTSASLPTSQTVSQPQPIPSGLWRTLSRSGVSVKQPTGVDAFWHGLVGYFVPLWPRRSIHMRRARRIAELSKKYVNLSDARMNEEVASLRELFCREREKKSDVDRAFAVVRELAKRELGMEPYVVQLAAASAIEAGCITELATGEGKTLVATLPAAIAGWRGRGCHVVTVNDYLAQRDAQWMAPLYKRCGLSVAAVQGEMKNNERRSAYLADVTYCTNKEVTADFLRDRLVMGASKTLASELVRQVTGLSRGLTGGQLVMRGLECAIVDEADSILIDEAVTPLIISGGGTNKEQSDAFGVAAELARQLERGKHYKVDFKYREIELTNAGRETVHGLCEGKAGLWQGARRREELVRQALSALILFERDRQYVVQEGKIVIVDEYTGRVMPDRTWRDGLHQAVEVKEGVEVNAPKDTLARVSFQRFFRMYRKLAGMTGTAAEAWREFWQVYDLPVVTIPTHRPCVRSYNKDRVFVDAQTKWHAVAQEVRKVHEAQRPVLVGTRSVAQSEQLSRLLTEQGLSHQVLNAVHHEKEAQVVAEAGQPGRVTVATNMAGRGTDIKLAKSVNEAGGLHVIACERHDSGRVDRQLFGRCARQGDPGSVSVYVSLDDELVVRYAWQWLKWMLGRIKADDAGELRSPSARRLFHAAQRRASRISLRQRKSVLKHDDWLEEYLGFAGRED
ncbi:MAG: hypothetical protein GC164_14765 [Phycisphaera sp.]|nr:hypothetical protein [Phycisphaera sp.]